MRDVSSALKDSIYGIYNRCLMHKNQTAVDHKKRLKETDSKVYLKVCDSD